MIGNKAKAQREKESMSRVWLALILLLIVALSGGVVTLEPVKVFAFQTATSVRVGGAAFSPTHIPAPSAYSNLTVSIGTGSSVRNGATATVEVSESSNLNGVSYSVSPSRSQTVPLSGGGISTNVVFRFTLSGKPNGGTILSRATITAATNATVGTPAIQDDLTLTVNPIFVEGARRQSEGAEGGGQ